MYLTDEILLVLQQLHTEVSHFSHILTVRGMNDSLATFSSSQAENMLIHFYFMALYKNKYAVEATAVLLEHASSSARPLSLCV